RALQVVVLVPDAGGERVARRDERVLEALRAREAARDVEANVGVVLEREGGLVLLDAQLDVAALLRFDALLRERERLRVRPSARRRRRGRRGRRSPAALRDGG